MKVLTFVKCSKMFHRRGFIRLSKAITYLIRIIYSAYIPPGFQYGHKLSLGYGALGIVIHDRAVVGDHCHISHGVTIGGTSKKHEVPRLGNYVYVGTGAKILGNVVIGDNVVIGANAVVLKDIPSNSLVVGVPAKVVKRGINKIDYI